MNTYQPYTYLIGWSVLDRWYYGVRYAKGCHPGDFWVKYFTSSYDVQLLRKQFGNPDVIQIRQIFETAEDALLWEQKVLHRLDAANTEKWINQTNSVWPPERMSEQSRKRISEYRTARRHTSKTRQKISEANKGQIPWNKGRKMSDEEITARNEKGKTLGMFGKTHTSDTKKKMSIAKLGKKLNEETKSKMSEAKKGLRWATNGSQTRRVKDLPEGWKWGRK